MPAEEFLKFVAAGGLEDGRIQLFGIQFNGQIVVVGKIYADPNSGWTDWSNFQTPPGGVTSICVGYLSDKRMRFVTGAPAGTTQLSCWKTTTDPNAAWTAWSAFEARFTLPAISRWPNAAVWYSNQWTDHKSLETDTRSEFRLDGLVQFSNPSRGRDLYLCRLFVRQADAAFRDWRGRCVQKLLENDDGSKCLLDPVGRILTERP